MNLSKQLNLFFIRFYNIIIGIYLVERNKYHGMNSLLVIFSNPNITRFVNVTKKNGFVILLFFLI
jgi:predicted ABC-type ATPase